MKEIEYNKIEFKILLELENILANETSTSNLKEIQILREKLRKLRLENLDKSNIDNLNII